MSESELAEAKRKIEDLEDLFFDTKQDLDRIVAEFERLRNACCITSADNDTPMTNPTRQKGNISDNTEQEWWAAIDAALAAHGEKP